MLSNKAITAMNDFDFSAHLLRERADRLQNPNTPFAKKLRCAIATLRRMAQEEQTRMKNSWEIRYYGEDGQRVPPRDVREDVLEHAAELIREGYSKGIEDEIRYTEEVADDVDPEEEYLFTP